MLVRALLAAYETWLMSLLFGTVWFTSPVCLHLAPTFHTLVVAVLYSCPGRCRASANVAADWVTGTGVSNKGSERGQPRRGQKDSEGTTKPQKSVSIVSSQSAHFSASGTAANGAAPCQPTRSHGTVSELLAASHQHRKGHNQARATAAAADNLAMYQYGYAPVI